MFRGFTEENVLRIAQADALGTWLRMQQLPSYEAAMLHQDMCHEVFPLLPVVVDEASIVMSQEEVRAMIEQNGPYPLPQEMRIPGRGGASAFGQVYSQ